MRGVRGSFNFDVLNDGWEVVTENGMVGESVGSFMKIDGIGG